LRYSKALGTNLCTSGDRNALDRLSLLDNRAKSRCRREIFSDRLFWNLLPRINHL